LETDGRKGVPPLREEKLGSSFSAERGEAGFLLENSFRIGQKTACLEKD